jgi:hypothetical protein
MLFLRSRTRAAILNSPWQNHPNQRRRKLKPWLDQWELVSGQPWQEALEETIRNAKSAAILIGKDGLTIKGMSGSISSGFTIEELRASDPQGNESVMEGLSLKWSDLTKLRTSRELIIEEIALMRAHIFIDSSEKHE